jgi:hypothetical protein
MTSSHSIGRTLLPRGEAAGTSGDSTSKTLSRFLGPILSLLGLFCVLSVAGCTTTRIEPTVRPLAGLPKPDRLVVHDFEVTPANAERNWDIVPQILQTPGPADQTKKELSIGATSVKTFVDSLIQELRSRGIGVERASEARPPEINTFSVRGRFLWIRQAHQGMRARVWFYQGTGSNLRLVAESDAVIRRDLQFGSAAREATVVTEEADARVIARELAERIAGYYRDQGWPSS